MWWMFSTSLLFSMPCSVVFMGFPPSYDLPSASAQLWPRCCPRRFPASCTPTSIAFCNTLLRLTGRFSAVSAPHHPAGFSVSDRNAALTKSVHCLPPVGGDLPLHQLRIPDSRHSVTKVNLLYTPIAPRTGPVSKSLKRCIIFAIPFRQFSPVIRLFRLCGECRDPMNRSKPQRGERVGAEIETPVH